MQKTRTTLSHYVPDERTPLYKKTNPFHLVDWREKGVTPETDSCNKTGHSCSYVNTIRPGKIYNALMDKKLDDWHLISLYSNLLSLNSCYVETLPQISHQKY